MTEPTDAHDRSSFEDSLARLQEIVGELERDGVDLDRALRLFEEGVERLRTATGELSRAEATVKLLVERTDGSFELPELGP
ncbi:MAG TPA: exodeoxyribonuclease VII small subunit [Gemmatirosa sp.]|nr:exodeoxyribonuclease VII small subunit [Gemmatirosa sp.]